MDTHDQKPKPSRRSSSIRVYLCPFVVEIYSTILGTTNSPLACRGAFWSASSCGSDSADFIGAGDIDQRDGVCGRLDASDVEFFQFFDVAKDSAELGGEFFFLVGRERDAREMRDVFDINFSSSHGSGYKLQV